MNQLRKLQKVVELHIAHLAMLLLDQVGSLRYVFKDYLEASSHIANSKSPEDIRTQRTNIVTPRDTHILVSVYRWIVHLRKVSIILVALARSPCKSLYTRTGKSTAKVGERE